MNDDNVREPTGSPRRRTAAVVAAVGVAGLVAGGLAAGAISAASASTDGTGSGGRSGYGAPGYGVPGGQDADPSRPMRGDEKLLTGTTRAKVLAAVKATYPKATVQRVETDSDGVYEAHVLNAGKPLTVKVGKDFTITGTETGPSGHDGRGGHGGPRGGDDGQRPAPPNGTPGSAEKPGTTTS